MVRCDKCGSESEPIFRFCLKCGTELPATEAVKAVAEATQPEVEEEPAPTECPHCEAELRPGRRFCVECGRVAVQDDEEEGAERVAAGRLVSIRADGSDGTVYSLYEGTTGLGRTTGEHVFTDDDLMDAHHADFVLEDGDLRLYDRESEHGTFVRIGEVVPLADRSQFRVGQQLLEVRLADDPSGDAAEWGEVAQLSSPSGDKKTFPLAGENVFVGRERGHVVFPDDGYVSGSHAVLFRQGSNVLLKDLDSSNGTYVRLSEPTLLKPNRLVLVGGHLFRVEI